MSLAAWCFLERVSQLQRELFTHLPHALGYQHGPPTWWYLLALAVGSVLVALALWRLPGSDKHIPAEGLSADRTPINLTGILLASFATIGFGLVLGPEVPLIALGGGLALLLISLARRDSPPQALTVIAAASAAQAQILYEAAEGFARALYDQHLVFRHHDTSCAGGGAQRLRTPYNPALLVWSIGRSRLVDRFSAGRPSRIACARPIRSSRECRKFRLKWRDA